MDLNKLRMAVFEKTGIKVETNDPIFALVALNDAVLAECVNQHISGLQDATAHLCDQTTQLIQAGERVKKMLLQLGETVEDSHTTGSNSPPQESGFSKVADMPWQFIIATLGISVVSAFVVLCGQTLLQGSHPPNPDVKIVAPLVPTVTLTEEQKQLIKNGEKYAKMWPKLDAKTQAKIQALSQ